MKTCNNELLMEMRKIVYYSSESHWTTRHYTRREERVLLQHYAVER
jgi:hypothetical protein